LRARRVIMRASCDVGLTPVLVNFVTKSGGANIGSLLAGVLK